MESKAPNRAPAVPILVETQPFQSMIRSLLPKQRTETDFDAPKSKNLPIFRILFIVFLVSFVFDYKAVGLEFGVTSTGGSLIQGAYLGIAFLTGAIGTLLGFRCAPIQMISFIV